MRSELRDYLYHSLHLGSKTQRWYQQKLDLFVDWCEEQGIEVNTLKTVDIERYLDMRRKSSDPRTGQPLSTQTVRGDAQVIKSFLRWLSKMDEYDVSPRWREQGRITLPKPDAKIIETFTREQIKRLFLACSYEYNRELQERDKAILRVLLSTGIRASELCGLTLDHTYLDQHDAHIKVMGKGRQEREIGLSIEARKQLYRYVTRWRHSPSRFTFLNRAGEQLTPDGLDQMLYRLRDTAGIVGVRCSAHTFRHTFALEFLRSTGDIYRLSRILGHANVSTTEVYLRALSSTEARAGMAVFDDL